MDFANTFLLLTKLQIAIILFFVYLGVAWIYLKIGGFILDYLFFPAFSLFFLPNWTYLRKHSELMSNENHIAVVLANDYIPELFSIYSMVDIKKLIKFFRKQDWPYKVYFRTNRDKLFKIINNPQAKIIYLIGHGQRHGIKVSRKEVVYYCEFADSPQKEFIAQLHCNHLNGKSLVEYISKNPNKSFVTNKKLTNFRLNQFIEEVVKGKIHGKPE